MADAWVLIGKDRRRVTLYDGIFPIERTFTVTTTDTYYNIGHVDITGHVTSRGSVAYTDVKTTTYQQTAQRRIKVVSSIVVTTREHRGIMGENTSGGTTASPSAYSVSITIPAYNDVGATQWITLLHSRQVTVTAPAVTETMTFDGASGSEVIFSSRRVNEAGFWVTTETTTDHTTTHSVAFVND